MKLSLLWPLLTLTTAFAQTPSVQITTGKTTSLIFPFQVIHIDRGTKDILVQQVNEAKNIILVKAASTNFAETNLSIITSDGALHSFSVSYREQPVNFVYQVPLGKGGNVETHAKSIIDNPPMMQGPLAKKFDIKLQVDGIYIKDNVFYYQLRLTNESPISYDVEQLRCYIRDKRKAKRTAVQENELVPLHLLGNVKHIEAYSVSVIVLAVNKFTIPDAKLCIIRVEETNGGRHLTLKLRNRHLLKAKLLPSH